MLSAAEDVVDMEIPKGIDPRAVGDIVKARLAADDLVKRIRPALFPEDDDG
jgi:hypothetical protein